MITGSEKKKLTPPDSRILPDLLILLDQRKLYCIEPMILLRRSKFHACNCIGSQDILEGLISTW